MRGSAALSGIQPLEADSASGGFVRQFPRLPVTPAVGRLTVNVENGYSFIHKKALMRQRGWNGILSRLPVVSEKDSVTSSHSIKGDNYGLLHVFAVRRYWSGE